MEEDHRWERRAARNEAARKAKEAEEAEEEEPKEEEEKEEKAPEDTPSKPQATGKDNVEATEKKTEAADADDSKVYLST
jgi:hypothetical protein